MFTFVDVNNYNNMKKVKTLILLILISIISFGQTPCKSIKESSWYQLEESLRDTKNEFKCHLGNTKIGVKKYRSDREIYSSVSTPFYQESNGLCYYDKKRKVFEEFLFNKKDICYKSILIPVEKTLSDILLNDEEIYWNRYNSFQWIAKNNPHIMMDILEFKDGTRYFENYFVSKVKKIK